MWASGLFGKVTVQRKAFFQGVDGDLMEDFATIQLSKLPIWDEMLKDLESKENQKNKNN